jgi:hypothetical protein
MDTIASASFILSQRLGQRRRPTASMTLKPLYQPLLQYDDEPDIDFFDHWNVDLDLDQQYHLVALARPATNYSGNDPEEDEDDDECNKTHNDVVSSSYSMLWSITPLLLLSLFYMPLLMYNYEGASAANLSWMMAFSSLSILLFVSTFCVLCHSVDIMNKPTRWRLLMMMMIVLLLLVNMNLQLLLALWENIQPRLSTLLTCSLFIITCLVIISTRYLLATYNKGGMSVIKKRNFGSHVLV